MGFSSESDKVSPWRSRVADASRSPGRLRCPFCSRLGWAASTLIGVDVDKQFTVFGAMGAIVFTLLSGLLLARFTASPARAA